MFIKQFLLHGRYAWAKQHCMKIHKSNFFQYNCVMNRIDRVSPPCKWAMTMYQHCRDSLRIFTGKSFNDNVAGFGFIIAFDFGFCHQPGTWNAAIKIITLGCAKCRNHTASLCKCCCPAAMGMHNAANSRKRTIQHQMGRCITGWLQFAFYPFAGL